MLVAISMNRNNQIKWLKAIVYAGIYGGLLMPLVFVPVVIFPFVFSKLLVYQILIGLTFPAYLILAWVEPKYRPRFRPLYGAILAYFVALALSVIFAVDPQRAWWGNQERMNGLFTLLHFFLWLTMAVSLIKTWQQWRKLIIYEVALSAFMAIVALLQIPFPRLLMFPAGSRVGGLLDNPIYMAGYQIFNLFFILLLWLKNSSRSFKLWLVGFAVLDIGAFIAAESRGALVGLFAAIATFMTMYLFLSPSRKAKLTAIGLTLVVALSYGTLLLLRDTQLVKSSPLARLTNFSETLDTRLIAWDIGWNGFLERPLTGWGLDDFHIIFNEHYNPKSLEFGYYETWFDRAHNTVIDVLSMTGLFGILTFIGIWVALFWSVLRAYRKKWIDIPLASLFIGLPIGYFVQNLFVFDQPAGFVMSFLLYAFIICASTAQFGGVSGEEKVPVAANVTNKLRSVPWYAFAILQAVALVLVWRTSVLPGYASVLSIKANNYFSAGNFADSLTYAKQAAAIPTPYLDEQTFLLARNLITLVDNGIVPDKYPQWREWHDLVVKVTNEHLKDHPENTHPHFIYARFLHSMSRFVPEDAALAEQQYKEALRTSPKRQQLLFSLGRFYLERGLKDQGIEVLKQAMELNPNVGESHWYYGLSLLYDKNDLKNGALETIKSQTSKTPYNMQDAREAVGLAAAYRLADDREGFKKLMVKLPNLSGGSIETYLEIAKSAEALGLIEERNLILGALEQAQPAFGLRLTPLQKGSATSIADSFRLTENLAVTSTQSTTTATTTSAAPTGSGPRK